jgi:uncharacterized protein (TIRG00374 family)
MARIVVAVVAILLAFYGQDWARLAEIFRGLNPWYFVLSLATFAIAQVVISVRWWLLLRAQSVYISIFAAIRLFFLGLFCNNVMPGAVGDVSESLVCYQAHDKRLEGSEARDRNRADRAGADGDFRVLRSCGDACWAGPGESKARAAGTTQGRIL